MDDSISTEVKAPIGGKSFNDLPAGTIINTSGDTSFNSFFWDTDFSLRISDEFELDLKGKFYNSKTSGLKTITVKGGTLSISAVWFPTFF